MNAAIGVTTLTGPAITPLLPELARLRIAVFRDFPYLYQGSDADEAEHLAQFGACADAALVVARAPDGTVVGCSTCLPAAAEPDLAPSLLARGAEPGRVFYFGESVLLPAYRGQGIGVAFFREREAHARSYAWCERACFASVRRDPQHPRRPADYQPLDGFWRRRGFRPWPGPPLIYEWRDIGSTEKSAHELDYWVKPFA